MWISDLSIRRPVLATMVIGALVALGWVSLQRIGVDLFPRVEFPYVNVMTVLEGASPDAIETDVTDTIEAQVNTISGIKSLYSESYEGLSQIIIEFGLNENSDVKAQDVRDKVNLHRDLRRTPNNDHQRSTDAVDPPGHAQATCRPATSRSSPTNRSKNASSASPASVRSRS
jgi:HAE1 family hydrophobic/amphiphilic exporter-1